MPQQNQDARAFHERYSRQIILKGFGETAQEKLSRARVLVVGAGGLGCPALQYLAAAGVGCIGIIDDDAVSLSNLHRQILFSESDVGRPKAAAAAAALAGLNSHARIVSYEERLEAHNAPALFAAYDLVLDGSDNFQTRYIVNDACVAAGKPLVHGAVLQYEGQVAAFNIPANVPADAARSAQYRDVFPRPPAEAEVPNCREAGVLGVLSGIIGCMMAMEAIKIIAGLSPSLSNKLLTYNALTCQTYAMDIVAGNFAGGSGANAAEKNAGVRGEYKEARKNPDNSSYNSNVQPDALEALLAAGDAVLVDIREVDEQPAIKKSGCLHIPMRELPARLAELPARRVVLICSHGERSRTAARDLRAVQDLRASQGDAKEIYSVSGGISECMARGLGAFLFTPE